MFDYIATEMASPFWWETEQLYHLFDEIDPEAWTVVECGKRATAVCYAPATFWLAVASTIPRSYTTAYPFLYLKGNGLEKTLQHSFTLFSLNFCAMPGVLPEFFGGVRPWKYRLEGFISLIDERNPDVICLQEIHDEMCAYALCDFLKDEYAHFYYNIGPYAVGFNSGLFVASKFPITDPTFIPFTEKSGDQHMVNKGFFLFQVADTIDIALAHLQPRDEDWETRANQLHQIRDQGPAVIVGDLNIKWGSHEAALLNEGDHPGFLTCTENFSNECTIDYVLSDLKKVVSKIETYSLENSEEALSDHHALFATIFLP